MVGTSQLENENVLNNLENQNTTNVWNNNNHNVFNNLANQNSGEKILISDSNSKTSSDSCLLVESASSNDTGSCEEQKRVIMISFHNPK